MSRARPSSLVILLALVALLGACASGSPTPSPATPGTPGAATTGPAALPAEVDVAEAARLRAAGAFVLDVREPDEWAAGHIEGATLIPLGQLAGQAADVPRDRAVVVVCRSGNRSAQGRDVLLAAGIPSVTSMAGGMNDWVAAGNPVVTGE